MTQRTPSTLNLCCTLLRSVLWAELLNAYVWRSVEAASPSHCSTPVPLQALVVAWRLHLFPCTGLHHLQSRARQNVRQGLLVLHSHYVRVSDSKGSKKKSVMTGCMLINYLLHLFVTLQNKISKQLSSCIKYLTAKPHQASAPFRSASCSHNGQSQTGAGLEHTSISPADSSNWSSEAFCFLPWRQNITFVANSH